jgi:peroxiredoxin
MITRGRVAVGGPAAAALMLAVLLASGCTGDASADNGNDYVNDDGTIRLIETTDRDPAPPLRGRSLDGGTVDVRDYPGRVVVVNYWASWCGPCEREQPQLNDLYTSRHDRGLVVVGIDLRDSDTAARTFRVNHQVPYPSLVDESGATLLGFHGDVPASPPSSVVLDQQGRIAAIVPGEMPPGSLPPLVDEILDESAAG